MLLQVACNSSVRSGARGAGNTPAHKRKVDRSDPEAEAMFETLQQPAHLAEGYVLRAAAALANDVMVIGLVHQMNYSGTMPEMDVVKMAGLLEYVKGPVDRRLVDCPSHLLFDPGPEIGGGEVIEV